MQQQPICAEVINVFDIELYGISICLITDCLAVVAALFCARSQATLVPRSCMKNRVTVRQRPRLRQLSAHFFKCSSIARCIVYAAVVVFKGGLQSAVIVGTIVIGNLSCQCKPLR
jgi:hypothetical protein